MLWWWCLTAGALVALFCCADNAGLALVQLVVLTVPAAAAKSEYVDEKIRRQGRRALGVGTRPEIAGATLCVKTSALHGCC
jgi:hypothetical protein